MIIFRSVFYLRAVSLEREGSFAREETGEGGSCRLAKRGIFEVKRVSVALGEGDKVVEELKEGSFDLEDLGEGGSFETLYFLGEGGKVIEDLGEGGSLTEEDTPERDDKPLPFLNVGNLGDPLKGGTGDISVRLTFNLRGDFSNIFLFFFAFKAFKNRIKNSSSVKYIFF